MTTRITRRQLAASLLLATLPCWFTLPSAKAASDPVVRVKGIGAVPSYTVLEVPIPGVDLERPATLSPGINDAGQVAGTGHRNEIDQAFRSNAAATSVTALKPLVNGGTTRAFAINGSGTVAGSADTGEGPIDPARFLANGTTQDLGFLDAGGNGAAYDINSAGTVVGEAEDNDGFTLAIQHAAGGELETLNLGDVFYSVARGINDDGMIVGERGGEGFRGFRYQNGEVDDIGTLEGGDFSSAYAVNSSGTITGFGSLSDNIFNHAVIGEPDSALEDLGVLPGGENSTGYAINDAGVVVGQSEYNDDNRGGPTTRLTHAFIWSSSLGLRDLNSLLKPNSGWELLAATGINNKGQIVGYGRRGTGALSIFRLTPDDGTTPPPGRVQLSAAKVQFGMIRLGQRRRQRLILQNVGNGIFSGEVLQAVSPFRVVSVGSKTSPDEGGNFSFSLAPRERVTVLIEFLPHLRARFRQRLLVTNDNASFPTLAIRMAGDACGRNGR